MKTRSALCTRKNPQQVNGEKLEDIHDEIKGYLLSQKQGEAIETFIEEMRKKSVVVKNEDWLKKINPSRADNPFAKAVRNGRPTVLDLGSNSCVPCKMMKPILDEVEKEYTDKANIVVLEIGNYRDLARQYRGKGLFLRKSFLTKREMNIGDMKAICRKKR